MLGGTCFNVGGRGQNDERVGSECHTPPRKLAAAARLTNWGKTSALDNLSLWTFVDWIWKKNFNSLMTKSNKGQSRVSPQLEVESPFKIQESQFREI